MLEEADKQNEQKKLGKLMMWALRETERVPHEVIAFCYSVFLPAMLNAYLKNTMNQYVDVRAFLKKYDQVSFGDINPSEIADKLV